MSKQLILNELQNIEDHEMRHFAKFCLDRAPQSFWKARASRNHHPPDERHPGGAALHTARVMRVAEDLARMDDLEVAQKDILIFCAMLHDLFKGGEGDEPTEYTWPLHQVAHWAWLPRAWKEFQEKNSEECKWYPGDMLVQMVCHVVEQHEGRWSIAPDRITDEALRELARLLHVADYIASRDYVLVNLDIHEEKGETA